MKVHTVLGPGLLESAYEVCLVHELRSRGLNVQAQVILPIEYEGLKLDAGYRIDLLVEETVIVELKAVERILPLHEAQILSYLRLRNLEVGLLINFNVMRLKDGRFVTVHGRGLILGASESLMSADPEQTGRTRTQCNGTRTRTRLVPFEYEYEYEYRQRLSTSTVAIIINRSWQNTVNVYGGLKRIVNNYSGPTPRSSAFSAVSLSPDFLEQDFQ